jgi:hypothetical protein
MKKNILFAALAVLAGSLFAADSSPKDDILNAAKKLADQPNYSWKETVENVGGRGFGGPSEGKAEKGGATWVSRTMRDNTVEFVFQGGKAAVKSDAGWQSQAEATADGDQPGPGMFIARMLQNFKAPAAQAQDLADKAKELKKDGEAYASELTEDGAKALLAFGRRGGAEAPAVSNAKGSVKFWVKEGVLTKYELKLKGNVSFNGNDREVDRTTTVEIKDVGATKVTVPEEAKKKLSSETK